MAKQGDNNPRAFGDTISLDAWRTPFNGETGEADLFVNVTFSDGRIGGLDSPVRFRLELNRAEVHVLRDGADILKLKPSSIPTGASPTPERTVKTTAETELNVKGGVSLDSAPSLTGEKSKRVTLRTEIDVKDQGESIKFHSMKTDTGYMFRCEPAGDAEVLRGSPWSHQEKLLTMVDTGHKRAVGEAPELRIELRCRREDLKIYDLVVLNKGRSTMAITADKMLALNQYIREELFRNGFMVADVSEPFSEIILADVSPTED